MIGIDISINSLRRNIALGVIDKIGVNPAAAYSIRRLSKNYSGKSIRVRRSSDNAESDIGFYGNGGLNTADLLAFTGAGSGFVTTWYDQSGNARNAVQATAANQPLIVDAGVVETSASKPAIYFDTALQTMLQNATTPNGGATTRNVIFSPVNADSNLVLSGIGTTPRSYIAASGRINLGNSYIGTVISANTPVIITGSVPSTGTVTQSRWANGSVTTGTTDRSGSTAGLTIGALTTANSNCTAYISEVTVFDSELSADTRQKLELNQGSYYGIALT